MTDYQYGYFGILNRDGMEDAPLLLIDGGIERRYNELYGYDNKNRKDFPGYLFQYTLNGSGSFEKNGQVHNVSKNKGFFVQVPEDSRYYLPSNNDNAWEFIFLHFDGLAVKPFWNKINKISPDPFSLDINSPPIRMALQLHHTMMTGKVLEKYEGGEFVYKFLCALLREIETPDGSNFDLIGNRAKSIIDVEYGTIDGIEELAERLNISFAHLSRSFKKDIGVSPVEYLTEVRLQSAMNDLWNTKDNLKEIAKRNGFSNDNYFCKVFRKHVGESPTSYRKRRCY